MITLRRAEDLHPETNASQTDWEHVYQIWLRPAQADLEPRHDRLGAKD